MPLENTIQDRSDNSETSIANCLKDWFKQRAKNLGESVHYLAIPTSDYIKEKEGNLGYSARKVSNNTLVHAYEKARDTYFIAGYTLFTGGVTAHLINSSLGRDNFSGLGIGAFMTGLLVSGALTLSNAIKTEQHRAQAE